MNDRLEENIPVCICELCSNCYRSYNFLQHVKVLKWVAQPKTYWNDKIQWEFSSCVLTWTYLTVLIGDSLERIFYEVHSLEWVWMYEIMRSNFQLIELIFFLRKWLEENIIRVSFHNLWSTYGYVLKALTVSYFPI